MVHVLADVERDNLKLGCLIISGGGCKDSTARTVAPPPIYRPTGMTAGAKGHIQTLKRTPRLRRSHRTYYTMLSSCPVLDLLLCSRHCLPIFSICVDHFQLYNCIVRLAAELLCFTCNPSVCMSLMKYPVSSCCMS